MGLLSDFLNPKEKPNPILDIDKEIDELVCEECGVKAPTLYDIDSLLFCIECGEAELRRKRFKDEEKEWNNASND